MNAIRERSLSLAAAGCLAVASVTWAQVTDNTAVSPAAAANPNVAPEPADADGSAKNWRGDVEADRAAKGWRRDDGFGEEDRRFDGRTYFNRGNKSRERSWSDREQFGAGAGSRGPIRPSWDEEADDRPTQQQTAEAIYWMMRQAAANQNGN